MPRKQRRQEPQAASSDTLPSYNQHSLRPKVRIELLGEGCIVWLPDKNENETGKVICIRDSCCFGTELDNEGYNHPVLVLKIKQDGICSFVQAINKPQVTSKQQKNRNRRDGRIDRLPISYHPTTDLDATVTATLYLEEGRMNRQSYVKTKHVFDIHVSQLRTWSFPSKSKPSDLRLTRQSYEYLAQTFGLQNYGSWIPTELLIKGSGRGYTPLLPQAVPVQPRRNTNPSIGNTTNSAPHPNVRTPLLHTSDIPYWQVERTAWNSTRAAS
ncbi:hypothetical protein CJF30_00011389 [Rutstroemia sp. NJR-2017a BBW]|nr:hypothetical protein CJF30_00011389 [Rutstroemia sp. NJR-2017a BBW]